MHKIQAYLPGFLDSYQHLDHRYKWAAVQNFQKHWDPVAVDFKHMLDQSIDEEFVNRFWPERPKYFKQALFKLADRNRAELQQVFQDFLYPRVEVKSKLELFQGELDLLFKPLYNEVGLLLKNHGHDDLEVCWMYLAFSSPEKYPFYRYAYLKHYLETVDARHIPGPKDWADIVKCHQVLNKVLNTQDALKSWKKEQDTDDIPQENLILAFDFTEYVFQQS